MASGIGFLSDASVEVVSILQAFAVAESLTDEIAQRIYSLTPLKGIPAELFLEAIHQSNLIVPRNSEWQFSRAARSEMRSYSPADQGLLSNVHRLLLDVGRNGDRNLAGTSIPAYLFTPVGYAFHSAALGNLDEALASYSETLRQPHSGLQWLAGVLSEQQQRDNIIPASAIEPAFLRGMSCYWDGKFGYAEQYFRRVTSSELVRSEVAISYHLIGVIQSRRSARAEALQSLDKAVALGEQIDDLLGLAMILNSRGGVKRDLGDLKGALADLDRAVDLGDNRTVIMALNSRGGVKRDLGDLKGALADLDRAVELGDDPRSKAMILNSRGGVKRDLGDLKGALADLDRAVELGDDPRSKAMILNSRGGVKRDLGDLKGALADLDRAVELGDDPRSKAMILTSRGGVKRDLGDLKGALVDLDRAIELGHDRTTIMALNSRGGVKRDLGDLEGALSDFDRVVELGDARTRFIGLVARALAKRDSGHLRAALLDLDAAKEIAFGVDQKPLGNQARSIRKVANILENASSELERSGLWRRFIFDQAKAALFYSNPPDPVGSIHLFSLAFNSSSSDTERAECAFNTGKAFYRLKLYGDSISQFRKAIDLGMNNSEVYATLARALAESGRPLQETDALYRKAIELDPTNAWALSWYGLALSSDARHDEAEMYARQAVAGPPGSTNGVLIFNLAHVLYETGEPTKRDEALKLAEEASRLSDGRLGPERLNSELS